MTDDGCQITDPRRMTMALVGEETPLVSVHGEDEKAAPQGASACGFRKDTSASAAKLGGPPSGPMGPQGRSFVRRATCTLGVVIILGGDPLGHRRTSLKESCIKN